MPFALGNTEVKSASLQSLPRASVRGTFLFDRGEKFYVKGVSYGAFRADGLKREYQDFATIERDFELMAACGINAVRIPHTLPPRSLLDLFQEAQPLHMEWELSVRAMILPSR